MIKPIVAFGDPVLKAESDEIEKGYPGLKKLISDMWELCIRLRAWVLQLPK